MNRRKFLMNSSLMLSSIAISNKALSLSKTESSLSDNNLSISMITKEVDGSLLQLENLIRNSQYSNQDIFFSEYQLLGYHIGDILYIKNNQLVDFRKSNDGLANSLQKISKEQNLPQKLKNPVLLRLHTIQEFAKPQSVSIQSNNSLVDQISIQDTVQSYRVEGKKGHVIFSLKNNRVRVTSTTCKHKTCIKMGSINKPGQKIVCIPNQIMIHINGDQRSGIDSITR